jgi:hypothetical protein
MFSDSRQPTTEIDEPSIVSRVLADDWVECARMIAIEPE